MEKIFIAKAGLLRSMLEWILHGLVPMEFDASTLRRVELASEEALVNIIQHAYQDRPEKIKITIKAFPKSHVEITFKDHGPPFDPLQVKAPLHSAKLEEREPGGLGIHLMRQYMDEVRYLREPDGNLLTLIKRCSSSTLPQKF